MSQTFHCYEFLLLRKIEDDKELWHELKQKLLGDDENGGCVHILGVGVFNLVIVYHTAWFLRYPHERFLHRIIQLRLDWHEITNSRMVGSQRGKSMFMWVWLVLCRDLHLNLIFFICYETFVPMQFQGVPPELWYLAITLEETHDRFIKFVEIEANFELSGQVKSPGGLYTVILGWYM